MKIIENYSGRVDLLEMLKFAEHNTIHLKDLDESIRMIVILALLELPDFKNTKNINTLEWPSFINENGEPDTVVTLKLGREGFLKENVNLYSVASSPTIDGVGPCLLIRCGNLDINFL